MLQENARQQFNAKNQMQVDNFFAELEAQVETANKNRVSAMNNTMQVKPILLHNLIHH